MDFDMMDDQLQYIFAGDIVCTDSDLFYSFVISVDYVNNLGRTWIIDYGYTT